MITPELPYRTVPHAGGLYVWRLTEALEKSASLIVASRPTPSNEKAPKEPDDLPTHPVIARPTTPITRLLHALARRLQNVIYRFDPTCPDLSFLVALLVDQEIRGLVRTADVIDLQWAEYGRFWPVLRLLNRHARLIGTFHDVVFQRLMRIADKHPERLRRVRWRLAAWISRRWETNSCRHLDTTIVFSGKDRDLLKEVAGKASSVTVVDPPLGTPTVHPRQPPAEPPTAAMIGYFGRQENVEAATWLLTQVWPAVLTACPEARLRLVGADPNGRLAPLIASSTNASVTGFVDDLWDEYARVTLTLVPLQSGAGVKFKTIESLLAGTPVVSTTVGAEGIGGDDVLTSVTDDPSEFASAIIAVLRDPTEAEHKAKVTQRWAEGVYGQEAFVEKIRSIYFTPDTRARPRAENRSSG